MSSLSKRIFIHFGPPKTGTSAIQNWMQAHRDSLMKQGILYPEHRVDRNGISSGNLLSLYDYENDRQLRFNPEKHKVLLADFDASPAHTLVLSSEFFASRLSELAKAFPQAVLIGYVRSPLEAMESHYNQSVKRHDNAQPIFLPKNLPMRPLVLLQQDVLDVGAERFQLRAYAVERFPAGDICADFLSAVGFEGYTPGEHCINPSYSLEALELKRWLNGFDLKHLSGPVDGVLQSYRGEITRYSCIPQATYERYRQQAVQALSSMADSIPVAGAEELIKSVAEKPQKPFVAQSLTLEQMQAIVQYIRTEDSKLFKKLCSHIHQHSFLKSYHSELRKAFTDAYPATQALPSRIDVVTEMLKEKIRALLGKKTPHDNPRLDLTGMSDLREKLKLGEDVSDGVVLRELALFAERNNQVELAYCLMSRAQKLRPTGMMIRNKLEQYAKKLEQVGR